MCEHQHSGCPHCGADTEHIRWFSEQTCTEWATIDDGGNVIEYVGDNDYSDPHDSGFYCQNCDSKFTELELSEPEDCECAECDPATAIAECEEDAIVLITRTRHGQQLLMTSDDKQEWPEIVEIYRDRASPRMAVRAERARELFEDFYDHIVIDPHTPIPNHLKAALFVREGLDKKLFPEKEAA